MPFLPLPNGLQVEVLHELFGAPVECTFTFITHTSSTPSTVLSAQLAVFLYWRDHVLPLLSRDLLWTGLAVTDLSVEGGERLVVPFTEPILGGYTASALPANVAARVNYIVAYPPGGRRGCMFLPGVPSDQADASRLSDVWRALVTEATSYLIDGAELQGWRWVVASKFLHGALRPVAVPLRVDITTLDSLWTAQRRKRLHNELYT